jgi:hypothetical protein
MDALRNEVRLENRIDQKNSFFVHVAGRENTTLFVIVPKPGAIKSVELRMEQCSQ